ncbi:MAG: cytoskeletal protein binding protein [Alyxoria varia]|nr:MAG: cytoskeletal protein binding protein [Alyxoria varia]
MGFAGVSRALYDYEPRAENELAIQDGDLLFILDKSSDDDWWKARKKAGNEDEEEPEGLVPNNYVEEAQPVTQAKSIYDYNRQTEEELSFPEDASFDVFDTSDEAWVLVRYEDDFGFVPKNYIEMIEDKPATPARPPMPSHVEPGAESEPEPEPEPEPEEPRGTQRNPASALAGIIQQRTGPSPAPAPPAPTQFTPEPSDEEEQRPSSPQRQSLRQPRSPLATYPSPGSPEPERPQGIVASPPTNRLRGHSVNEPTSPGGYHLYNIHEMISHMGKNKKMPTTLGINVLKGVIMIAPEKSRDGPQKEWTAEKLQHYSLEGKHVFVELIRPSKSIDFHAGAKDTAHEIVSALGELAGVSRAEGLREVIAASSGSSGQQRTGEMLFEFMAQGDDEVTVAEGDEVLVLDDTKSEEWMMVKRLRNGKEGVVPTSYVKITGVVEAPAPNRGITAGASRAEQNRLEEERLAKEALRSSKQEDPGVRINPPNRTTSVRQGDINRNQKSRREHRDRDGSSSKSLPNSSKVRTWTDRTGSFKVQAEFLGLKDGKIHLHKTNGVKIAVPVSRMSVEDIEYVEKSTGQSLDEEKPLSEVKRRSTEKRKLADKGSSHRETGRSGAAVQENKPKHDWFDFFLQCGCNPQVCERYASSFDRDQMGEESLQDIDAGLLRTLGLKEGDILRVMKHLDDRFGRTREKPKSSPSEPESDGIFSGPGGTLRNNTKKGRPAPAVANNDTVDPRVFEQNGLKKEAPTESTRTPIASAQAPSKDRRTTSGFDDDAWDVKPAKQPASQQQQPQTSPARVSSPEEQAPAPPQKPVPTGAMAELSLLSEPLKPEQRPSTQSQPPPQTSQFSQQPRVQQTGPQQSSAPQASQQQPQATGANPALFSQIPQQQQQQQQIPPQFTNQPQQQHLQQTLPRQRPQAPSQPQTNQNSLLPPPPNRSSSAPLQQQPSAFAPPPLHPQMTGYQAQVAPPGQSLNDLNQQKFQQQQPLQNQSTGYGQQPNGYPHNQFAPLQPQQTGPPQYGPLQQQRTGPQMQPQQTGFYQQQQQFQPPNQQQFSNGQQTGSPFADPPRAPFQPQPTGFQPNNFQTPQSPQQMPQPTGINSFLPPAIQPQQTGYGNYGGNQGFSQQQQQQPPPMPPIPQQPSAAQPLQPQKTGPAPPVKFGVQPAAQKLTPQPTGRANLANATPQNPFGF